MIIYRQKRGEVYRGETLIGTGYSGLGEHKNDPLAQHLPNIGPIPQGAYWIGDPYDTTTHGPYVMNLTPVPYSQTFGRHGFLIHGDNSDHTASHGCIILDRPVREQIGNSRDKLLVVLP